MTYRRPQASYRPFFEDHEYWWVGLLLMVISAAIVLGVAWLVLSAFLSLAPYIPSQA